MRIFCPAMLVLFSFVSCGILWMSHTRNTAVRAPLFFCQSRLSPGRPGGTAQGTPDFHRDCRVGFE
jgi:hypothetical protein